MYQYLSLLDNVMKKGTLKESGRAGMPNTKGIFGYQMRFNLGDGFPLLTTKKMPFKAIAHELIWFLRGETNIKYLVDNGVNIWNGDAYRHYKKTLKGTGWEGNEGSIDQFIEGVKQKSMIAGSKYVFGDLGEVYGSQWRNWTGISKEANGGFDKSIVTIDQIAKVISQIKKNPFGRRHIVSAWNPAEVDNMALPPCHLLFQFNCRPIPFYERTTLAQKILGNEKYTPAEVTTISSDPEAHFDEKKIPKFYLDCALTQRSCDSFLGVPFNIASYALLTEIVAKMCNMIAGEFVWTGNDTHIYDNHVEAVTEQLKREPFPLCRLKVSDRVLSFTDIAELDITDLTIENYQSHPAIKAELSVGT